MRCKACRHTMVPYSKAQVPLILPLLLAAAGIGGAAYLVLLKMLPVAVAVANVGALGGVMLAAMRNDGARCPACGLTEAMDPIGEQQADAEEKSAERERARSELASQLTAQLRPQIADQLRPALEDELRPQIEDELRPKLAEELRAQYEEELRPRLAAEVRQQVEREVEARLRPEIERQVRASLPRGPAQPAASSPMSRGVGPAASAPASASAPTPTTAQPTPPRPRPLPGPPLGAHPPTGGLAPVGQVIDPHARAQRRARVIVSDIALYHKEMVEQAARSTDPKRAMDSIWEEAVRSYNETVTDEVRRTTNYLDQAFDALLQRLRKEMNLT
ncbi:MAG TPA: hypothetical protein VKN99_05155 [Polyangia bacterium]|nr:hypothetical protein [Polyangia bacterium]